MAPRRETIGHRHFLTRIQALGSTWPSALAAALLTFSVAACAFGASGQTSPPPGSQQWNSDSLTPGDQTTVCGPVAGVGEDPQTGTKFINLGVDYPAPNRFTIVLWEEPSDMGGLAGDQFCATGTVARYEGSLQITANTLSEVE